MLSKVLVMTNDDRCGVFNVTAIGSPKSSFYYYMFLPLHLAKFDSLNTCYFRSVAYVFQWETIY